MVSEGKIFHIGIMDKKDGGSYPVYQIVVNGGKLYRFENLSDFRKKITEKIEVGKSYKFNVGQQVYNGNIQNSVISASLVQ